MARFTSVFAALVGSLVVASVASVAHAQSFVIEHTITLTEDIPLEGNGGEVPTATYWCGFGGFLDSSPNTGNVADLQIQESGLGPVYYQNTAEHSPFTVIWACSPTSMFGTNGITYGTPVGNFVGGAGGTTTGIGSAAVNVSVYLFGMTSPCVGCESTAFPNCDGIFTTSSTSYARATEAEYILWSQASAPLVAQYPLSSNAPQILTDSLTSHCEISSQEGPDCQLSIVSNTWRALCGANSTGQATCWLSGTSSTCPADARAKLFTSIDGG